MKVLITGTAGFIGFHLAEMLLRNGHTVRGIDAMTDYYDVELKYARHNILMNHMNFMWTSTNLEDKEQVRYIAKDFRPDVIVHLAAQAGVRYSIEEPQSYLDANIQGTFNILEVAKEFEVNHLLAASTSSVYGANNQLPFREDMRCDTPQSFYAATKLATEHMAHSYAHIHGLPVTMLRFFTVYGPWGRPDLALFKFAKAMLAGLPIDVYNDGDMMRDFTYVEDVAMAVNLLLDKPPAKYRTINIGNGKRQPLMAFIDALEKELGINAKLNFMPMQPGDVQYTEADTSLLQSITGFQPETSIQYGIREFVRWYREHYRAF